MSAQKLRRKPVVNETVYREDCRDSTASATCRVLKVGRKYFTVASGGRWSRETKHYLDSGREVYEVGTYSSVIHLSFEDHQVIIESNKLERDIRNFFGSYQLKRPLGLQQLRGIKTLLDQAG